MNNCIVLSFKAYYIIVSINKNIFMYKNIENLFCYRIRNWGVFRSQLISALISLSRCKKLIRHMECISWSFLLQNGLKRTVMVQFLIPIEFHVAALFVMSWVNSWVLLLWTWAFVQSQWLKFRVLFMHWTWSGIRVKRLSFWKRTLLLPLPYLSLARSYTLV